MEFYAIAKHIHMTCAGLTLFGFLLRGYWMMTDSAWLNKKPVKILPHIIDTLLLGSAIYLMIQTKMYPFVVDFITIKIFLLIAYIVLGTIAIKRGKTKKTRIIAFVLALISVLAIFATASMKPSF